MELINWDDQDITEDEINSVIMNEFLSSFIYLGVSVVDDKIVNIILKNETFIPVKAVQYTKEYSKRFIII